MRLAAVCGLLACLLAPARGTQEAANPAPAPPSARAGATQTTPPPAPRPETPDSTRSARTPAAVAAGVVGTTWLPDSSVAFTLGEIIVTADRPRHELRVRSGALEFADLAFRPGSSASELLKALPGVSVSAGRKDEASVAIRGFGARRVAILVDGRPMNLPYYGTFDLASLDADKLEGIRVVRGPASVTYGPNVMGGVVNFLTARGRDHPGTRLRVSGGSHNTGEILATHGRVMGRWDLFVTARGGGSDGSVLSHGFRPTGYPGTEEGGYRDNSHRVEVDLFAKLGYRNGAGTDAALSCGYLDVEKGVPSAIDEERYWRFTDWRRFFGDLTLSHKLGPAMTLQAKAYGDVFVNTLVDYEDGRFDPAAVFYSSTHDNWDLGGIVSLEHDWSPRVQGTYGASLREDQIKKRMNPDEPWLYHHQLTGSVYNEYYARLGGTLRATLGLADHFVIRNHLGDVDHSPGFAAGLTMRPAPDWGLIASAGQGTRFPTLSQLWSQNTGNRELRPEVARRFEVGADWTPGRAARTELTLFWNELHDLIDRDNRRAGRYYNIRGARSRGLELDETVRPWDWLEIQASYTYTQAENRDTGQALDLVPEHKIDGRLTASAPGGDSRWTLIVTRVGSRFDSESLSADQALAAYTVADCLVASRLGRRWSLTLEVMNVGDVHYEEEVMYPAPGRTVLISAAVDL